MSHKSHVLKRREKFYQLAKQQGYRSRAAFKLIQLNKKYNFLANSKACLDLGAAPGGWLQVCSKHMPVSSLIIGIDILPIRPLPNVITLVEDLTTQSCRAAIKKQLQGWQVDLVLHDGAPNVGGGAAWAKDTYVQIELVLHSLKLATEFLVEGGTFVTKIFRSADYMALTWVLKQFFRRVDVTRPSASRQVSAEIFAVCQGYLAPKKIDPKLFDPQFVFKPTEIEAQALANKPITSASALFGAARSNKPNRSGYTEDRQIIHDTKTVSEFIAAENPTSVLASCNALVWDDAASAVFRSHKATTPEIDELLKDVKVLGTSDFSQLFRWHRKLRAYKAELDYAAATAEAAEAAILAQQQGHAVDDDVEVTEMGAGEDSFDDAALDDLNNKLTARKRRELKKKHEEKMKELRRQALNATARQDADSNKDDSVFHLRSLASDEVAKSLRQQGRSVPQLGGLDEDKFAKIIDSEHLANDMGLSSDEDKEEDDDEDDADLSETEQRIRLMEKAMSQEYAAYKKRRNLLTKKDKQRQLGLESSDPNANMANTKAAKAAAEAKQARQLDSDAEDDEESSEESDSGKPAKADALSRARDQVDARKSKVSQLTVGRESAAARAERWFGQSAFDGMDLGISDSENSEEEDEDEDEEVDDEEDEDFDEDEDEDDEDEEVEAARASGLARAKAALSAHVAAKAAAKAKASGSKGGVLAGVTGPSVRGKRGFSASATEVADTDDEHDDDDDEEESAATTAKGGDDDYEDSDLDSDSSDSDTEFGRDRWLASEEEKTRRDSIRAKAMAAAEAARGAGTSFEEVPLSDYTDDSDARAEILAIGTKMLRRKARNAIVEAAYNKYAHNDLDELPEWFADEENRHNKAQLPVTKAEVDLIKEQLRAIDARSIRKIAESKARKKKKAIRKMERAKLEANTIIAQDDVSAADKMKQIEKLYKTTRKKQTMRPAKQYVINTRGGTARNAKGKLQGGPGKPFLVHVDKRMRADKKGSERAAWRREHRKKR